MTALARANAVGAPPGDGGPETDPRAVGDFKDDRPEIRKLFEQALEGRLPRTRELKPYEPQRMNERHLSMIMMRASGLKQRQIAKAFGATDANVSVILNHPDAEYLLTQLQSMRATRPSNIEERIRALTEPSLSALETALTEDEDAGALKLALRRAPLAFRVLEMNGHSRKRVEHEHKHQHRVEASPEQVANLAAALRESRQIQDVDYVILDSAEEAQEALGPGNESPRALPSHGGAGAPSIGDSQAQPPASPEEAPCE